MSGQRLIEGCVRNPWNNLTVGKKNLVGLIKECYEQNVFSHYVYLVYIYQEDLASNNLQRLICHKAQLN